MNEKLRKILGLVLLAVMVFCLFMVAKIQYDYDKADRLYAASREEHFRVDEASPAPQAGAEKQEYFPAAAVDFEGLLAVNEDITGWLWIPGTEINFPLVQDKETNATYLNRGYDRTASSSGSIFLDYHNAPDFTDGNTVIYGHNMKNGGMFGKLKEFGEKSYLQQNSTMYIFTPERTLKYRIFAAYVTTSTSESYVFGFGGELKYEDYLSYVAECAGESLTELPEEETPLVMLSTCTSRSRSERFVVHACLEAEQALSGGSAA